MNARIGLGCLIGLSLLWQIPAWSAAEDCEGENCEEPAPYILRIIKSGEGKPRSTNNTDKGLQDNRRTDVTLTRKVPTKEVAPEIRQALFGTGGAVYISKDPTSLDRILTVKAPASMSLVGDRLESAIGFEVQTNYAHFIDKLEILLWADNATQLSKPLLVKTLDASLSEQLFELSDGIEALSLKPDAQLQYSVRAYDSVGRFDESNRQYMRFVEADANAVADSDIPKLSIEENVEEFDGQYEELARQSIPLQGSKVRILGQDLKPSSDVLINGQSVSVDSDGRFGLEYLLPAGEHVFDVVVKDDQDQTLEKQLKVELDADYFFMVALADVTVGKNTVSGSLEPLAVDPHHYGGDIFVDGRLAFYLKGKVKGKYLITAQMDTGTENIEDIFDNFHRRDPDSVFRRLDPEQYYPVYGDDSTLIDDTDSQGKLYVRVDWDRSRAVWGNFNTNFNGTEYAPFNRSLYGAQLNHSSTVDTPLGDASHSLSVFASRAQSLFRHNEFLGTGGSLYYLRDSDIVIGSEKVWVEVREDNTTRVIDRIELVYGRDYDIDDFQGRLILRRPLLSVAANGGPSIIRDEPLEGNQTFLVVDYEYIPQNLDFNDSSFGARGKKWVTDNLGIGGTWVYEKRDGSNYEIRATDVTLKRSNETFIKGEFAQSESSQTSGSFISTDGGLSFDAFNSNTGASSGRAFGIEARASLNDFSPQSKPFELGVWARREQAGFSTATTDTGIHTTDVGVEAVSRPTDSITVFARASRLERRTESVESYLSAQVDYALSDNIVLSGEARNQRDENLVADTVGESTVVAGKVSADLTSRLNVYGIQQLSVKESGAATSNNATTVGARYAANDNISVSGELSSGDRGESAVLGTEVNLSDTYSVYTNYTYSFDQEQFEKNSLVFGQRKTISSQLQVYSEHQFTDEDARDGYAHTVGLDQKFNEYTSLSLSAQKAAIENEDGSSTDRNSVSAGLDYRRDYFQANAKLEYRWDEGVDLDIRQWVTTNRFEYRKTPSFRWQGRFNGAITDDDLGDDDARFVEAGIGFAYRPVQNDRLNMLGRLTYLNDLQPNSQSTQNDQRSTIASIEGLYDLSHTWSVGGKLAHRRSEIRLERNTGAWIDNDANLAAARVRYKARFGIDASASYHWLFSSATEGSNNGALFTIGRRVGDHLTFSVGYNFTSFDDNLANDSFDSRGWFINLIGTY